LACMFFQSPSLLEFQRQLNDPQQRNNLFTLFNMTNIPQDSQLRERLDYMDSEIYRDIFNGLFEQMRRDKVLELTDEAYQACRKKFGSKKNLWNTIRTSINLFVVSQWYWLMDFILVPDGDQFKMS
jgi:hypothetical protein